jgi:hypothetical protein
MTFKDKAGVRGIVRIVLKDKEGNKKPLFQTNWVWELLFRLLKVDFRIPLVTGHWTLDGVTHNTVTNAGLAVIAKRLGQVTVVGISHMALGIGTPSGTALGSEVITNGGERTAVTPTSTTTTVTDDTITSVNTFSFTGALALTEEGLFNHSSAGSMIASSNWSVINVDNTDSLEFTHSVIFSAS